MLISLIYLVSPDLSLGSRYLLLSRLGIVMYSSNTVFPNLDFWFLFASTMAGNAPCCRTWYHSPPSYSITIIGCLPFLPTANPSATHIIYIFQISSHTATSLSCTCQYTDLSTITSHLEPSNNKLAGFCILFLFFPVIFTSCTSPNDLTKTQLDPLLLKS